MTGSPTHTPPTGRPAAGMGNTLVITPRQFAAVLVYFCDVFFDRSRYLFVCEKGTDRIIVYAFDSGTGRITTHSETMVTIGGGARHLSVHPDGKHVFVNEEAGAKITSYGWDATAGVLAPKQSLTTLPAVIFPEFLDLQ